MKHASFLYDGSVRIAFDPWEITLGEPVDLVLVSHGHYDHCDPDAILHIVKEGATVVAASACADKLSGGVRALDPGGVLRVGPARTRHNFRDVGGSVAGGDVTITATEAYNQAKPYHPRGEGVGFLVAVDGGTIFHAGDTDDIPETRGLKPDLALLPVGGTYTMDVDEAVSAARAVGAAISIPMHYGYIVGSPEDGERFAQALGERAKFLTPQMPFPAAQ